MNFAEDKTFTVTRLHYIGTDGNPATAENVSVRFTTGWVSVVSDGDGDGDNVRVLPRDRVVLAEGVGHKSSRVMVY